MRTTLPQLAMTNDNDLTQSKYQAQQCVPAQWSVHLTTCMQRCIGMLYRAVLCPNMSPRQHLKANP